MLLFVTLVLIVSAHSELVGSTSEEAICCIYSSTVWKILPIAFFFSPLFLGILPLFGTQQCRDKQETFQLDCHSKLPQVRESRQAQVPVIVILFDIND